MLKHLGGTHPPEITSDALDKLRTYQWPGNVRQLRNCLERAVLLSNEGMITANELPPEVARLNGSMPFVPMQSSAEAGPLASSSHAWRLRPGELLPKQCSIASSDGRARGTNHSR